MKLIKYYKNIVTDFKKNKRSKKTENGIEEIIEKEPIYEIQQSEYICIDKEFSYWLDVIKKTYGEFGKVTYESIEEEKTEEEIKKESLIKNIASLTIENKKKDLLISNLAQQINNLNIKITQMEVEKNV